MARPDDVAADAIAWLRTPAGDPGARRPGAGSRRARRALPFRARRRAGSSPTADYVIETIRASYPDLDDPLPQPLAPFRRRRPGPLGGAGGAAGRPPDELARAALRSGGRRACCSTPARAMPGATAEPATRRGARPLRGPRDREPGSVPSGTLSADPARAAARRRRGSDPARRAHARRCLPGERGEPAGRRSPAAAGCSTGWARRCWRSPEIFGADGAADRRAVRPSRPAGAGRAPARAGGPRRGARGPRRHLARADRARRRQPRRRRPPPGRRERRSHQRAGAVPQALAVARLLADRAARGRRHRGHRPRPADRARRVPQRRPADRSRRAAARSTPPCWARRTPAAPRSWSNGAR